MRAERATAASDRRRCGCDPALTPRRTRRARTDSSASDRDTCRGRTATSARSQARQAFRLPRRAETAPTLLGNAPAYTNVVRSQALRRAALPREDQRVLLGRSLPDQTA